MISLGALPERPLGIRSLGDFRNLMGPLSRVKSESLLAKHVYSVTTKLKIMSTTGSENAYGIRLIMI